MKRKSSDNDKFVKDDDLIELEYERRKRIENIRNKKKINSILYMIVIALFIGVVIVFSMIDTGAIGTFKKNAGECINEVLDVFHLPGIFGNGNIDSRISNTFDQESKMVPFENAASSQIQSSRQGLIVAKSNHISLFDKKGRVLWETQTSVVNPILKSEGNYILLAEKGGRRICLFRDRELVFSADAENDILNAELSSSGDVALVTKKEFYKNAICVYNKNGEQVFAWNSGADTIVSVDISSSSRTIAASLINTEERVKSYVMIFDINKKEADQNIEFTESAIFNTEFIGETLNVVGDNRITGISISGDVEWNQIYTDDILNLTVCDADGNRVVVSENNNIPKLTTYSGNGKEKKNVDLEIIPDCVDISDNVVVFNSERVVVFGNPSNLEKYITSMDIQNLKVTGKESFVVVYNNSLEFINAK